MQYQAGGRAAEDTGYSNQASAVRPVALSAELIEAFVQNYLAHKYDNPKPTPQFHREMWEDCCNEEYPYCLEIAPRGHAKSTAITEAYGMAALLFRLRDFAVIISNTVAQSVEFLGDFKQELQENEQLRQDFGILKLVRDREDDIIVKFRDGYKFRVVAKGSEQKVRGLKWNKRRPNLVIFDDLEDDEQVISKERRTKFSNWFMRAVLPFGADDCLFRGAATILHFDSLAQNLAVAKDEEGNLIWKTRRYQAHKAFDDFSEILWPEKFNEKRLRGIRAKYIAKGDKDGYSQEYLNIPIAEGDSFFRKEDLQDFPRDQFRNSLIDPSTLRIFASWDFAITKNLTSDWTAGVVIGVDERNRCYTLDVRRGRWDSLEIVEEMFSVQRAWDPEVQFAENGQIEKTLGPFLYKEMQQRAEHDPSALFNLVVVPPRTKDKVAYAASWRAQTRAKRTFYDKEASWYPALEQEMVRFPKDEHDDQVDAHTQFGQMLDQGLEGLTPAEAANEEDWERIGKYETPLQRGASKMTAY